MDDITISPECRAIRQANFSPEILFHTPGFRGYQTSEHDNLEEAEFVSVSVTGTACALRCEHCNAKVLRGMLDLSRSNGSLYDLCAGLAERGTRGVLISGGSDRFGRVPLLPHIPDLLRIRRELGLVVRVHVGLPDEETCAALGSLELGGAMIDIIGHADTIRDVYHLAADPEDYEEALAGLEKYHVPVVPHIVLGLHFGKFLGEVRALEMVLRHPPSLLVLVVLESISKTGMANVIPPALNEIGAFFERARKALPTTPLMLGCARPMGAMKAKIDRLAVDAGFNGIAYPANEIAEYTRQAGLQPKFMNACCGVTW
jgi:lipoyl synthase